LKLASQKTPFSGVFFLAFSCQRQQNRNRLQQDIILAKNDINIAKQTKIIGITNLQATLKGEIDILISILNSYDEPAEKAKVRQELRDLQVTHEEKRKAATSVYDAEIANEEAKLEKLLKLDAATESNPTPTAAPTAAPRTVINPTPTAAPRTVINPTPTAAPRTVIRSSTPVIRAPSPATTTTPVATTTTPVATAPHSRAITPLNRAPIPTTTTTTAAAAAVTQGGKLPVKPVATA
jgi:hypothetical protein